MKPNTRSFRGIDISEKLWNNKELSIVEKAFLMQIRACKNPCKKSDKAFAASIQCTVDTVSRSLDKLERGGWIKINMRGEKRISVRALLGDL